MAEFKKERLEGRDAPEFTTNKTWWMNEDETLTSIKDTRFAAGLAPGSAINLPFDLINCFTLSFIKEIEPYLLNELL